VVKGSDKTKRERACRGKDQRGVDTVVGKEGSDKWKRVGKDQREWALSRERMGKIERSVHQEEE